MAKNYDYKRPTLLAWDDIRNGGGKYFPKNH